LNIQLKTQRGNIAIFDTFKTRKDKFTGEAKRQRGIIAHLATEQSPELRTRTSIAHAIAKKHDILWQNIYSGIFKDLEEILIPLGIVRIGGRLPLRRGPRALQLEGVPFYELTEAGLLVASCIDELGANRMKLLESYILSIPTGDPSQKVMCTGILLLIRMTPCFVSKIISEYIYAYSRGLIENLTPIDVKKLRYVISKQITIERELVEAFDMLQEDQKETVRNFFKIIS
jgi:hypothetical protein